MRKQEKKPGTNLFRSRRNGIITFDFFIGDLVRSETGNFFAVSNDKMNDAFLVAVVAASAVPGLVIHGHKEELVCRSRSHVFACPIRRNLPCPRDKLLQGVVGWRVAPPSTGSSSHRHSGSSAAPNNYRGLRNILRLQEERLATPLRWKTRWTPSGNRDRCRLFSLHSIIHSETKQQKQKTFNYSFNIDRRSILIFNFSLSLTLATNFTIQTQDFKCM